MAIDPSIEAARPRGARRTHARDPVRTGVVRAQNERDYAGSAHPEFTLMLRALAIALLALLGGCNMVITQEPLFSQADAAGAARLREGVWAQPPAEKCAFDEAAPIKTWPSCANGLVVARDTLSGYSGQGDQRQWNSTPYVLAAGEPRVMQFYLTDSLGHSALAPALYIYIDLNPTRFDDQGRITEFQTWFAMCGPPPPQKAIANPDKGAAQTLRMGTLHPLAGLTMDKDGNNCTTASQDAVRRAAAASRAWSDEIATDRWLRDGDQ
jgi:hypothetical protein